jgi:hypothetical protein
MRVKEKTVFIEPFHFLLILKLHINKQMRFFGFYTLFLIIIFVGCSSESNNDQGGTLTEPDNSYLSNVGFGWSKNSVNTVIFRHSSLTSNSLYQFISYYDQDKKLILGRREPGAKTWETVVTPYSGNATDAHTSISIIVDGEGYLHVSWDHHNNELRYCKSVSPGSMQLTSKMPMTGLKEGSVTYPEFYRLSNGNLIFVYRDGSSGDGNLMMNSYDLATRKWKQLHDGLVDGQGLRNAYWQLCVDKSGTIHLSWVWRETGDVATNHDLCYAKSTDGGITWKKSTGEMYQLPINAGNAEYVMRIPQNSELINTTTMCADDEGRPMIATYWRDGADKLPQYHLVYYDGVTWKKSQISSRISNFTLSGGGTKRIPISRPVVVTKKKDGKQMVVMVFRDSERSDKPSVAICQDLSTPKWVINDLNKIMVGSWEPSFDKEMWKNKGLLHLFLQYTDQVDGEGISTLSSQPVFVLECKDI